jgi:hypothetical protein
MPAKRSEKLHGRAGLRTGAGKQLVTVRRGRKTLYEKSASMTS